ncbi:MAG TPA: hypothetical protein VGQ57_06685 [Polyangiaceae bacterium]|nr:hypothetical protein [Polyangiaceae bacterium]
MSHRLFPAAVAAALVTPALAASTPASSGSVAAATPTFPVVHGADLPSTESPAPATKEWKQGKRVAPTRGHAEHCELALVREWLRVRCPGLVGAGLIAGDARGVSIHVVGHSFTAGDPDEVVTLVVLPLRRGKTHLIGLNDVAMEYASNALSEGGVVSVQWREGRADPVIVLSGIPATPGASAPGFGME